MIVIVESPFAGDMEANRKYAVQACADCFRRGETPFASHLLYPQILDELRPEEREQGITAGYDFWPSARKIVFYVDYGWSPGMIRALSRVARFPGRWEPLVRIFNGPPPTIPVPDSDEDLARYLLHHPLQMDLPT